MSFGPLIDLSVDGVRPGRTLPLGGRRKATIRVQAPVWARPQVLKVVVDGKVWRETRFGGRGHLDATRVFLLPATARSVLAMVDGPADVGAVTGRAARPLAMSAAVRIGN